MQNRYKLNANRPNPQPRSGAIPLHLAKCAPNNNPHRPNVIFGNPKTSHKQTVTQNHTTQRHRKRTFPFTDKEPSLSRTLALCPSMCGGETFTSRPTCHRHPGPPFRLCGWLSQNHSPATEVAVRGKSPPPLSNPHPEVSDGLVSWL